MDFDVQWFERPLGEVTWNHDGKRRPVKESERKKGPYPYYGASGIVDYVDGYLFEGRHLLIAEDGENLRTRQTPIAFMADGKFWVNNHAHIVTGNGEVTTEYLNYFLQNADIQSYLTGAVMPKLTQGNLNRIPVRYPTPDYQKSIVRVLGSLDAKIDLNRRINQTLEVIAQATFKSWFVDFDPVKAKIAAIQEGRDRLRAAMSAISGKPDAELDGLPPEQYAPLAATAALFPDEMEGSVLGAMPRGWALATLSTMCELNTRSWNAKTLPASVKYVDLGNTKNGEVIEVQTMEGSDIPSRARRVLEVGDTIVGTVRPGNRSFALVGEAGLTGSTGFAVLRPKKNYLREYIYLTATSDLNIERLTHLADGGAYPAVRPEFVVSDTLPIPQRELLREFHRIASYMFDQILANRRANRALADLRDTLLPKLLSGEVPVHALTESTEAA